jgi:hypothetical protein
MVPRHDDRENHDQNQKALGGFGSHARVKVNGRHHPNRAPPDEGPGLFYCLEHDPEKWAPVFRKVMLKTKST